MTITYAKLDLTTINHGVIAHGCNCQGVMGSGVAFALRNRWRIIFDSYHKMCVKSRMCSNINRNNDILGCVDFVHVEHTIVSDVYVANVITQQYYGRMKGKQYADLDAIQKGMTKVLQFAVEKDLPVYMPKIGCGLGGLDWDTSVREVIEQLSEQFHPVQIFVCEV